MFSRSHPVSVPLVLHPSSTEGVVRSWELTEQMVTGLRRAVEWCLPTLA